MQREQRIALVVATGTAVALTPTLHTAFGWVEAAVLAGVVAVLGGLYALRHYARRALVYDRPPPDGAGARRPATPRRQERVR